MILHMYKKVQLFPSVRVLNNSSKVRHIGVPHFQYFLELSRAVYILGVFSKTLQSQSIFFLKKIGGEILGTYGPQLDVSSENVRENGGFKCVRDCEQPKTEY